MAVHTSKFRFRLLLPVLCMADLAKYGPHNRNAGFFIWLDLSPFLPVKETNGDGWAAEDLLSERITKEGVTMATGRAYQAPEPGRFRFIFSLDEETLREGIRR